MASDHEETVIRLEGRHLIGLFLIVVLAVFMLGTYVNAMISYRPSTVSPYAPRIIIPPNKPPVADAGTDQKAFVNATVSFDGSGSTDKDGVIVSYLWSFGDGDSASGVIVSHRYAYEGVYTVNLTVADDDKATNYAIITVTVTLPTPDEISRLGTAESAVILSTLPVNASADILMNLNSTLAAEILMELNVSIAQNLVEAAVDLNQSHNASLVLLSIELKGAVGVLVGLDPDVGVEIVGSMMEVNITGCANVVEAAVLTDVNRTTEILEGVDARTLAELLVEIAGLRYTPSTVAVLFETLSIDKVLEVAREWISLEALQELGSVLGLLTQETLNDVFARLSVAERAAIYSYLSMETTSLIRSGLLPLPDVGFTPLTVTKLGSRGYNVSVGIKNQGNVGTGSFLGELRIDGRLVHQFEVLDLSAGNLTEEAYFWRPTLRGAYTLKVTLDPDNTVEEIDETNNVITKPYGVELPDLKVAFKTAPTEFVEGKTYVFEVEISNIGEEEADEFKLTLSASGIVVEKRQVRWVTFPIGSSEIARLPAGSSEFHEFSWKPEAAGAYTLEAMADPVEQVLEGDRTNNDVKLQIEVEERPKVWLYLVIGGVMAMSVLGILLLTRPQTFNFITGFFRKRE